MTLFIIIYYYYFYCDQVRRAIQQMMFPNKTFYWPRHIAIAAILLTFINLLVIFAPNILGIFGVIGKSDQPWDRSVLMNKHQQINTFIDAPWRILSSFNDLFKV